MAETPRTATKRRAPLALFDTIKHIEHLVAPTDLTPAQRQDFAMARSFLQAYTGSVGTFNSYRRDVERLLQWTWHIADKVLMDVKRDDMEAFIRFCQKPPSAWIGIGEHKKAGVRLTRPAAVRNLSNDDQLPAGSRAQHLHHQNRSARR